MNSFQKRFKEEVKEYFERLEVGLLLLEQDPTNHQVIDEIFRIMHSLKGSGGMFGFDLLSDVTHDLESLYELFRSGKVQIYSEVINFTLKAIDGLDRLLVQEPGEEHFLLADKLKSETLVLIERLSIQPSIHPTIQPFNHPTIEPSSHPTTYFISFVPDENIFDNGTNPLYLIDELNALGECNIQISFDQLPELFLMIPTRCYASWTMFIATCQDAVTLQEVFIFVNESAKIGIEKVSAGNAVHNPEVMADFLNGRLNNEPWTVIEGDRAEALPRALEGKDLPEIGTAPNPRGILKDNLHPGSLSPRGLRIVDSIRIDYQKVDQYLNLVSELTILQSRLAMVSLQVNHPDLEQITGALDKISHQLRDNAFDMGLIPLKSIEVRFKRLIQTVSLALGKKVELVTMGLEMELDKTIIEKLTELLLHMIRNSLDHGIESPGERLAKSKSAMGTITLKASAVGNQVEIELSDDGVGLDTEKIRAKALEKGLITENDHLSDQDLFSLIFEPGFTTSDSVTDVSGRGVGMDVVRRKVHEMRGSIQIESAPGSFTRFNLKLPLSLSIIDGMLTRVGNRYYVVPSSAIKKIVGVSPAMLKKEIHQVLELEGSQLAILNLHAAFDPELEMPDRMVLISVFLETRLVGLVVDEVIHEYQAVIKPLGNLFKGPELFCGASIMGNGLLALVLDTNKIIQNYS